MPSRVHSDVKLRAVIAYASSGSVRATAKRFMMARLTLEKALQNYAEFGSVDAPNPPPRTGRLPKLHKVPAEVRSELFGRDLMEY